VSVHTRGTAAYLLAQRLTTIRVKVKPNAAVSHLVQLDDGTWLAHVKAPPVDGRANDEVLRLVSRRFGRRKADVSIRSGTSARTKWVQIRD